MVPVSRTIWSAGTYVKNGILKSGTIPSKEENGNWSFPNGVEFDIEEEKLTDEMTITIKYLGKDIKFNVEKIKGDE